MTSPAPVPRRIRIGTRGSALAVAQARRVADLLTASFPGVGIEIVTIDTQGDRDKTSSLTVIGGQGVFTSAVQEELLAGAVDIAVHSAKDLPARSPDGLVIAAIPEREDARDVLVSRHGVGIAGLPPSPVVGTSSRRRAMEILALRPDAVIRDLRGNVDTRLRKAESGEYDAIVIAAAGLGRLGALDRVSEWLEIDRFVPAPGQGALAVEARAGDEPVLALIRAIDDPEASAAVRAERAFLAAVGVGCTVPLGAHVRREGGAWVLRAMYGEQDGDPALLVRQLDPGRMDAEASACARELASQAAAFGGRPRVLVTRAASQSEALASALAAAGFAPIVYPVIRIAPPERPDRLDAALREVASGSYDWVIFTSANAVDSVASRLESLGLGAAAMAGARVAAVGRATAAAIARQGWPEPLIAGQATGAGLAQELAASIAPGSRVLHPRGDLATDEVAERLGEAGASVSAVVAYRTLPEDRPHPHDERIQRGELDSVIFASPSSVRNLAARLGGLGAVERARVVCVGPVTAGEARALGLPVHAVALDATVDGMVAAVRAAMQEPVAIAGSAANAGPEERA